MIEVPRTNNDNIQPGHTSSGKLGQTQHNHTSSGKLEYVQPNWTICDSKTKTQHVNRKYGVELLSEVYHLPTNTRSCQGESQLYIFQDNEAVIKMMIKGRSPTMRHVSRTYRVALDRLFDRIHMEPTIEIKYFDTKNKLADILTKSTFTRDEWNNHLHLFNFSFFSASYTEVVAKSKPTFNLVSRSAASSTAPSSSALSCPGDTQSTQSARFESHSKCRETCRCGVKSN